MADHKVINAIRNSGATGTASEVAIVLNTKSIQKTDSTRYSYQGLVLHPELGQTGAAIILALLGAATQDVNLDIPTKALFSAELLSFQIGSSDGRTGGLDFSRPERQAQIQTWIDQLTALGDTPSLYQASVLAKLKLVGVWYISPYEKEGGVGNVLEQDVVDAQVFITTQDNISSLLNQLDNRVISVRNNITNNTLKTWSDITLALGAE